jgi:UDP-glucose 4-epimerase
MKVLMTGGAGYVGSACLRWLLKHGHDAIAYDNLSAGNRQSVPSDRLVVGDLLDLETLSGTMRDHGSDVVMHFAALASVPESIAEPDRYWRTNVIGTRNVLDAMRTNEIDRILFSSTAATYKFGGPMPITEETAQEPQVPYGTTKLAAERMIKDEHRAFGVGYAILRYFNASGADPDGMHGEARAHETHLIPLIIAAALGQRDKVMIFGDDWDTPDGTCVRDYVHTDDLASAHQMAMEQMEAGSQLVFNVGSGGGASVKEVLDACQEAAGRPIPHEYAPRRPGDPATLVASPRALSEALGWKPALPDVRQIVETAWRWHSTHPDGYSSPVHPDAAH